MHHTARKELRKFGISVGLVLCILGGILLYKGHQIYVGFFIVGGLLALGGTFIPSVLRPIHRGWMTIVGAIGWFNTRLFLGLFFYFIFTPVGLIGRLLGHNFLDRKIDRNANSYWIIRKRGPFDPKRMERLY